jgi:tRNA pseudouridine38-40 synthase
MRVAVTTAYDGTTYLGSQIQKESPNTIFGAIQKVLTALGIDSKAVPSGRTDRGVHATGQVFHIDLPTFWSDLSKLTNVLNSMLPASINIKYIKEVDDNFHARYSAKKRSYRYIIKDSNSNPFSNNYVTFLKDVNFQNIQTNIKLFIGEHDFVNFMKTGSDSNSTTRIIYKAFAYQHQNYIVLYFEANGFLRSQIRMMVGSLLNLDKEKIVEKLTLQTNHKVKPAPENGLYLAKINY